MFSIVNCIENRDAFGDSTAEMFDSMNTEEFRGKLEETMNDIHKIFVENQNKGGANEEADETASSLPNANDIYSHVSGMLGGKLGQLAKEIAEETADTFNMDMENATGVNDVLQGLMKNPTKMMNLVKNVGQKLDSKIKSGDIKESELISEASEMIKKMKDIPGMGNIQDILGKMGIGGGLGKGGKVNLNAMQEQLNRNMKAAQTRERMRNNVNAKQQQQTSPSPSPVPPPPPQQKQGVPMTDEELIQMMSETTNDTNEKKSKKKKANKKK
jgi:hypothetical protein